jgi:hypothetical protein
MSGVNGFGVGLRFKARHTPAAVRMRTQTSTTS